MNKQNEHRKKIIYLAVLVALITLLHNLTPTEPHSTHILHIILSKLYILPILMAAGWFGLRGGGITALAVSVLLIMHLIFDWPGSYLEQANQLGELVGFWVAGIIPGWLFDRQRSILQELSNANEETLIALVSALDLRERNTRLHSQRVREYTELIAKRFGLDEKTRRIIGLAALLHDVGKIAVPDHILLKRDDLTPEEWREMRKHPEAGYSIVKRIGFLKEAAEIVRAHHEHYDGRGYPRGLRGEYIPLGARLFSVADVYDALTSQRPYKSSMTYEAALAKIREQAGSHFDPLVVAAFMTIPPEELQLIAERYEDADFDASIKNHSDGE